MYKKILLCLASFILLTACSPIRTSSKPAGATLDLSFGISNSGEPDKNLAEKKGNQNTTTIESKKDRRIERTLSIIKPDAVSKNVIGKIITRFENNNLKVVAAKMVRLTRYRAERFYAAHKGKPFFKDLVKFMTSGRILAMVLEGENAVAKNREIMGSTDPKKAAAGTIRADFGTNIQNNAVHGSDSSESAATEVAFFFKERDINSN